MLSSFLSLENEQGVFVFLFIRKWTVIKNNDTAEGNID